MKKKSYIGQNSLMSDNSRIGCFTTIGENCRIGERTEIGLNVCIEDDVIIGDDCVIGNNVTICNNVEIGDYSLIEDDVAFVLQLNQRAIERPQNKQTKVGKRVQIRAKAVIESGSELRDLSVVDYGVVIKADKVEK